MNSLLDNAIQSLQLGIEDYRASDPRRTLSGLAWALSKAEMRI